MADLIVLIIIALAALIGYKKGFVSAVFNLGYHLVALIVAAISYPFVTDVLTKTKLYEIIYDGVLKKAQEGNFINIDGLPEFLKASAQSGADAVAQNTAATVTDLIVTIISVVVIFVAVKLILSVVSKALKIFSKIPVIKSFNKLGGFIFGLLSGVIIVYVLLAVLAVSPQSSLTQLVTSGNISSAMYNSNLVLQLIFR